MNIGFDGKRATNNFTGLGNYSRTIITLLARFFPANKYHVYTPKVRNDNRVNILKQYSNIYIHTPIKTIFKSIWRSFGIKKQLKVDQINLLHGLSHEIPFGIQHTDIKSIVTIHDLIYIRYPHYFKYIDRQLYNLKFRYACKHADRVIAISQQTKDDIVNFFGTDPSKIDVVYQGCDPTFSEACTEQQKLQVREKYQLPDRYILNVGTIETRKNLLLTVKAFQQLDQHIHLVVIGKPSPYLNQVKSYIEKNSLQKRVHIFHNIPFNHLPAIYQMAEVFAYPSRFEGFGIPIIEALYSKIPVVAATGSCLEEAGGPHSLYVHPDDVQGMHQALLSITTSKELRMSMIDHGTSYVQRFNDDVIAHQLMNVYQKTLEHA